MSEKLIDLEDIEGARRRIEIAMEALENDDIPAIELQLQRAYKRLGGEKEDLYNDD